MQGSFPFYIETYVIMLGDFSRSEFCLARHSLYLLRNSGC